jgi:hypothetical protein
MAWFNSDETDAAEKCDRQRAGFLECLNVDDARPRMITRFQAHDAGEVYITENSMI